MSSLDFPSGIWTGFFTYRTAGGRHGMDLSLSFSNGRITGDGADEIGLFVIAGTYDATGGECSWTKTYVGGHEVFYHGFREEKGIWGNWEIRKDWSGGFHIWPLGDENAVELELSEEAPVESGAPL